MRLRDYLEEAWSFTLHPVRTARQWVTSEREFLNPLRFLAVGFAFAVAFRHVGELQVLGQPSSHASFDSFLSKPWATQLVVVLLALTTHPWIRWLGSKAPLRASVGISIFVFAGPAGLLEIAAWTISAIWHSLGTVPLVPRSPGALPETLAALPYSHYPLPVLVATYGSFLWMIAALAGVHQLRWWKSVLALVAGYITTIGVFGVAMALGGL